jgi:tryptophanyl-tRNA synthetase
MTIASLAPADASFQAVRGRSEDLEAEIQRDPTRFRVLTGDRPTGRLHLGHYFGTLLNRVRLQRQGVPMMVLIADYQVVTDRDTSSRLPEIVDEIVADYLAVGIDPEATTIFAHSRIPELNQLLLPFLSLVSVAEIGRNPTVKEEFTASGGAAMSGLMFTYPVHQAADILFCRANLVPVGKDQLPHLEITRTIARRFNERYGDYFPEPDALLSSAGSLLGVDGHKMSKSRGNAIALAATADETARLVKSAKTDGERRITYEPERRPEVANLALLAALCQERTPEEVAEDVGDAGSAALKRMVTDAVNDRLAPVRSRRAELMSDRSYLRSVLDAGTTRARGIAEATLADVRRLMHMAY